MAQKQLSRQSPHMAVTQSNSRIVICTEGLTKRCKEITAVSNISFRVHRGEVFGLLGPNGAGKTTTISLLLGLIRPTVGSVEITGHDMQTQAA